MFFFLIYLEEYSLSQSVIFFKIKFELIVFYLFTYLFISIVWQYFSLFGTHFNCLFILYIMYKKYIHDEQNVCVMLIIVFIIPPFLFYLP